jgi:hypothetical protein
VSRLFSVHIQLQLLLGDCETGVQGSGNALSEVEQGGPGERSDVGVKEDMEGMEDTEDLVVMEDRGDMDKMDTEDMENMAHPVNMVDTEDTETGMENMEDTEDMEVAENKKEVIFIILSYCVIF